ncbi:hypothetical protein CSKR_113551 [Clonorchis sinensis]|uniref:Uncharacterized protein n=1 Tax=Clonorchis sinensis TaxID=79923 RepID=A0A3R7CNM3_CLOSI|nr:hypothetical protein CSKR_113551 [Clonorchis sinensis]
MPQWLEREFTGRHLRLDFSCLGSDNLAISQPSFTLLVAWHRKGATAERLTRYIAQSLARVQGFSLMKTLSGIPVVLTQLAYFGCPCLGLGQPAVSQSSSVPRVTWRLFTDNVLQLNGCYYYHFVISNLSLMS